MYEIFPLSCILEYTNKITNTNEHSFVCLCLKHPTATWHLCDSCKLAVLERTRQPSWEYSRRTTRLPHCTMYKISPLSETTQHNMTLTWLLQCWNVHDCHRENTACGQPDSPAVQCIKYHLCLKQPNTTWHLRDCYSAGTYTTAIVRIQRADSQALISHTLPPPAASELTFTSIFDKNFMLQVTQGRDTNIHIEIQFNLLYKALIGTMTTCSL